MVDVIGHTTNTSASLIESNKSGLNDVDFNTFLKLLVTQLKNQDPLNPMEGTEFTAQIATFSQLEQQIATNTKLENLLKQDSYGAQSLAVSYIGKEVLVPSAAINVATEGQDTTFAYTLDEASYSATVQIRDQGGNLVLEIDGSKNKGTNKVTWDGKDTDGNVMPVGEYTISVSAVDTDGKKVVAIPHAYLQVAAIEGNGQGKITVALIDNTSVDFEEIVSVRGAQ